MDRETFEILNLALAQANTAIKSLLIQSPETPHYHNWLQANNQATLALIAARSRALLAESQTRITAGR